MKLFITGISGLLGLNAALQLRDRYAISGCYHRHAVRAPGITAVPVDLTSFAALQRALRRVRPDLILHTAGLTNVDSCEDDPALAHRLNVTVAEYVASMARELEARLIHISSDHLFNGRQAWVVEEAAPCPINVYARTKRDAEQAVRAACPDALIVRTNFYGWGTPYRSSLSDWILSGLSLARELTLFTDVYFTPMLLNDLIDALVELMSAGAEGVFHVAGGERLSKCEFGYQIAAIFNYLNPTIRPIRVDQHQFRAQRPKDMSLSTAKVAARLGRTMPGVADGLRRLKTLREAAWVEVLRGAMQETSVGSERVAPQAISSTRNSHGSLSSHPQRRHE